MFPFVVQLQIRLHANDRAHFLKRKSFQSTRVFARAFVSPAHEVRNVCRYLSHCASKFTAIDYFKKIHFPILSVDYTVYFYFSGDGKNSGVDYFLIRLSSSSYSKQNSLGKITVWSGKIQRQNVGFLWCPSVISFFSQKNAKLIIQVRENA